jgi:hypothetical protein
VQGKHRDARNAFLAWVMVGKPWQSLEFVLMKNTRAQFKLALRYCREHENMMRCDGYARSLATKDYYKFWSAIKKREQ